MRFRPSAWAIRNPIPIAILFVALALTGLVAYLVMPIKQYPNVAFPIVEVTVTQNGAAPAEMETQITRPVEDAIAGVPNVKYISSTVTLGASTTVIQFELGTEMQKATDDIRTAIDRVRVNLPPGIDPPLVQRIDVTDAPILTYAVSSPTMSAAQLSWFVDDTVARTLQSQKGVAQVARVGGVEREINVILDPDRMIAFGVTAPEVNAALAQFNTDEPGGRADVGAREQTIRVLGQAPTVDRLRELMIPVNGHYVRLSDIAEIGDGASEARGFATLNGRPAIAFQVNKTSAASDVSVETAVLRAIDQLARQHKEVTFTKVISTVDQTRASFSATVHVLFEGMVLAALVVLLFLRNWRATAITAIAMPLSLLPTFFVMSLLGFSLNVITLLALTLVIGILVDDAIVEIENIEKRVEAGMTPYRASIIGADAIGLAVVATTATIVVVFTPVSFMSGISGQYFKEFGLTVAVAVTFSLIVARLLTPLLAAYFLKPAKHPRPRPDLPPLYRRSLDWALRHKWISAGIGGLIFLASMALTSALPAGFMPKGDPGYFYLNVEGPPGATLADMKRSMDVLTRGLMARPNVERVFVQVGAGSGSGFGSGGGGELNSGTVTVVLKPHRTQTTEQVKAAIRPLLREVPDARITTLGGFGSADVEIVLSGNDPAALDRAQLELEREMRRLKQISNVRPAPPPPGPEIEIRPKPAEAARLNVNSLALAQVIRIATIGDIDPNVAKFSEGERRIPIRVRLPEAARSRISTLSNLQVPTLNGKSTPLYTVADISFQAGPGLIVRYGRERRESVQADLNGVALGTALKAINQLPILRHLPPGVRQPPIGDAEALADMITAFTGAIAAGIFLIYAVLVLLFQSFFKPATILSALPLSTIGAFLALLVTREEMDMPVFIGLLMLLGLAAKNSILLVEFAIEDQRAGQSRIEALMNACRERARPIIMTTVAMSAGMLPTALGLGEGSEFRQPMAVAVIGGLMSSTLLSLVLVPVVYEFVDGFEHWLSPKLARFTTPKSPGDDAPIDPSEETLVTEGV